MTLAFANSCTISIMKYICFEHIRSKIWVTQIFKSYFLVMRDNSPYRSNTPQPKCQESTRVLDPKAKTKKKF